MFCSIPGLPLSCLVQSCLRATTSSGANGKPPCPGKTEKREELLVSRDGLRCREASSAAGRSWLIGGLVKRRGNSPVPAWPTARSSIHHPSNGSLRPPWLGGACGPPISPPLVCSAPCTPESMKLHRYIAPLVSIVFGRSSFSPFLSSPEHALQTLLLISSLYGIEESFTHGHHGVPNKQCLFHLLLRRHWSVHHLPSSNMFWQSLRNGLADVPRRWTLRF